MTSPLIPVNLPHSRTSPLQARLDAALAGVRRRRRIARVREARGGDLASAHTIHAITAWHTYPARTALLRAAQPRRHEGGRGGSTPDGPSPCHRPAPRAVSPQAVASRIDWKRAKGDETGVAAANSPAFAPTAAAGHARGPHPRAGGPTVCAHRAAADRPAAIRSTPPACRSQSGPPARDRRPAVRSPCALRDRRRPTARAARHRSPSAAARHAAPVRCRRA